MRAATVCILAALTAACGTGPQPHTADGEDEEAPRLAGADPVPARFGIGRPADPVEIAALDIDVMPDGTGLPAGSGSVARGGVVYAARCATCHGSEGEGNPPAGGPLVAQGDPHQFDFADSLEQERTKTVGSYWPYATTVFDYVRRAMPFDQPGSLTDEQVYSVTAWLLWKNGVVEEDIVLDRVSLPRVRMPAQDRFVPDDRASSTRVR